jgi:hypothetical protein
MVDGRLLQYMFYLQRGLVRNAYSKLALSEGGNPEYLKKTLKTQERTSQTLLTGSDQSIQG